MREKRPAAEEPAGHSKRAHSREQAIQELQAYAARHQGHSPTMRQFQEDPESGMHPQRIANLWGAGGWNQAKRAAGLQVRWNRSEQEMLETLRALSLQLGGEIPRGADLDRDPLLPSAASYRERFGSLSAALHKAGLTDPETVAATHMVGCGVRLARQLGHPPSWTEWEEACQQDPSLPSRWQIYRRFGGGEGAWRMFTYEIIEATSESEARTSESGSPADRSARRE